jgi:hypothetical protein
MGERICPIGTLESMKFEAGALSKEVDSGCFKGLSKEMANTEVLSCPQQYSIP